MAPKKNLFPFFFSIPTPAEGRGEPQDRKTDAIWKETLHNVAPAGNEALRMIFSEDGGEQCIFCYLTVLLRETDHNSGWRGGQQTVHISSPLQHAPGPD